MNTFIHLLKHEFYQFYQDTHALPVKVDLESNLSTYSFKRLNPKEYVRIQGIMNRPLDSSDSPQSPKNQLYPNLNAYLRDTDERVEGVIQKLKDQKFEFLQEHESGVVLTHPDMSRWLIKQNFSFGFL